MKRYISHKIVEAAQILEVAPNKSDPLGRCLRLDNGTVAEKTGQFFARYVPVPGDYLVRYSDGYESVSPKKAFEEGYTLYQEEPPI